MRRACGGQLEILGRRFDAIKDMQADAARDAAMIAEREFVTELACTLRLPVRSAESLIAASRTLMQEMPATRAALQDGSITYRHAQVIMQQAWSLPDEAVAGFEQALLKSSANPTVSGLKYRARVMRERLHPEPITARHRKSVADRAVFLLGHSAEPGHLEGYGPIDPDTAREIAARAPSFIRLLTHPETGVVLSVGRTRYTVPKDLRRYLRVRDETCRWPGCRRAAAHSDLDHNLDWQFEGITAHDNLARLCPADHALKSETQWSYVLLPDGTLKWTSPTGRTFIGEPATIIRPPGRRTEKPELPDKNSKQPRRPDSVEAAPF